MSQTFSVVMPVRNAGPYLDDAIQSILAQSRGDFEFIIGDDGSTDGSRERARDWARRDDRIRTVALSDCGLGPAGSSNLVAREAKYPIVARMDADDVSRSDRFERQLAALGAHPDAVLVGSLFDWIDAKGRLTRRRDRSVLIRAGCRSPFAHGSIMYRREAFERAGGYREHCNYFEDFDLFLRMARHGRVLIIPEPLFAYRYSKSSGRLAASEHRVEDALNYYFHCLEEYSPAAEQFPPERRHDERPISPTVIVSLGTQRLWSGHRPSILARLRERCDLGLDGPSVRALLWAIWAAASPGSLRACYRTTSRWRDVMAGRVVDDAGLYEWTPSVRIPRARTDVATRPELAEAIAAE